MNQFENVKFDFETYIDTVAEKIIDFEDRYFKTVDFWEISDFEHKYEDLPACYINSGKSQLQPGIEDAKVQNTGFMYSNMGTTDLYLYTTATILLSNKTFDKDLDNPHRKIRKVAYELAHYVTTQRKFGTPSGMAQVTHVNEIEDTRIRTNNMLGWEVVWMHVIRLGDADDVLCPENPVDAVDVKRVMADQEIPTKKEHMRNYEQVTEDA